MPDLLNSYLRYARGESGVLSPWAALNFLGFLARPLVRFRNSFFDRGLFFSADPPIPVISVGNLCHGGTNKTPMVEMITRTLMSYGLSVGIVSRGYGGETKSPMQVGRGGITSDRSVVGDEPLMLVKRLPGAKVVVSRDRYDGVRLLSELGAEVAVADDAFQHRRMGRDLDIVLVDATCPFGNGRLFPAGILREQQDALSRADIVILTKTEQAEPESVRALRSHLSRWIEDESIFEARVRQDSWLEVIDGEVGEFEPEWGQTAPEGRFLAFSAIGNPESFNRFLARQGIDVADSAAYRDHHRFSWKDLDDLERRASEVGATGFICTEKDLQNLPKKPLMILPLYIPRISVSINSEKDFWSAVTDKLRPNFVVTSNGYGEDAIGALLAARLRDRFPEASISAFSLVGVGKEYKDRGIEVFSPESNMPSGGVVKYSFRALLKDFKHGLRRDIKRQIVEWRAVRGVFRTPICVGDVYLFGLTLWGQGLSPVLVATAKSVQMNGHWGVERALLRRKARMVWTRDEATAGELSRSGVKAVFSGNPIMDLALDADTGEDPWGEHPHPRVMLLPGSRPRAYDDIKLLLDAVKMLSDELACSYIMVLAPTIDRERMLDAVPYECEGDILHVGSAMVNIFHGAIASVAYGADILIGLGGTANQVSAGLGVPVVSILEKGKLAQKKLLRDAELLVPPTPEALSRATADLIADPMRRNEMTAEGIKMLGGPGAVDAVCRYAADDLGWAVRCRLYSVLAARWGDENVSDNSRAETVKMNTEGAKEVEREWIVPEKKKGALLRLVKIIRDGLTRWG